MTLRSQSPCKDGRLLLRPNGNLTVNKQTVTDDLTEGGRSAYQGVSQSLAGQKPGIGDYVGAASETHGHPPPTGLGPAPTGEPRRSRRDRRMPREVPRMTCISGSRGFDSRVCAAAAVEAD